MTTPGGVVVAGQTPTELKAAALPTLLVEELYKDDPQLPPSLVDPFLDRLLQGNPATASTALTEHRTLIKDASRVERELTVRQSATSMAFRSARCTFAHCELLSRLQVRLCAWMVSMGKTWR